MKFLFPESHLSSDFLKIIFHNLKYFDDVFHFDIKNGFKKRLHKTSHFQTNWRLHKFSPGYFKVTVKYANNRLKSWAMGKIYIS